MKSLLESDVYVEGEVWLEEPCHWEHILGDVTCPGLFLL